MNWKFWLVLLAPILVYGYSIGNGFIAFTDDQRNLVQISTLGYLDIWTQPIEGMFAPITYTIWKGIFDVSKFTTDGVRPAFFHGASLLCHVVNTALVFRLAQRFGLSGIVAALLFSLHPIQVESVAWMTEFRGLLGTTFLLSMFFTRWPLIFFVLAVLSKNSMLIGFPFLAYLLWNRGWRCQLGASVGVLVWLILGLRGLQDISYNWMPNYGHFLGAYTLNLLIPLEVSPDYGFPDLDSFGFAFLGIVLMFGLSYLFFSKHKSRFWVGIAVFLMVPYLGWIETPHFKYHSTMADRYMYLVMIPIAFAFATKSKYTNFKIALCLLLSIKTISYANKWQNSGTLYTYSFNQIKTDPTKRTTRPATAYVLGRFYESQRSKEAALYFYNYAMIATEKSIGVKNERAESRIIGLGAKPDENFGAKKNKKKPHIERGLIERNRN